MGFLDKIPLDPAKNFLNNQIKQKITAIRLASTQPETYRRGLISGAMERLNPKSNEVINQAILDMDDLANNGNTIMNRRQFLVKAKDRAMRRNRPIIDDISHKPMEKIADTLDTVSSKIKFSYFTDIVEL